MSSLAMPYRLRRDTKPHISIVRDAKGRDPELMFLIPNGEAGAAPHEFTLKLGQIVDYLLTHPKLGDYYIKSGAKFMVSEATEISENAQVVYYNKYARGAVNIDMDMADELLDYAILLREHEAKEQARLAAEAEAREAAEREIAILDAIEAQEQIEAKMWADIKKADLPTIGTGEPMSIKADGPAPDHTAMGLQNMLRQEFEGANPMPMSAPTEYEVRESYASARLDEIIKNLVEIADLHASDAALAQKLETTTLDGAKRIGKPEQILFDFMEQQGRSNVRKATISTIQALQLVAAAQNIPQAQPGPVTTTVATDSAQISEETKTATVCTPSAVLPQVDVSMELFRESAFYKRMLEAGGEQNLRRVQWYVDAAAKIQALWEFDQANNLNIFKDAGLSGPFEALAMVGDIGDAESYSNDNQTNGKNNKVLGPMHWEARTFMRVFKNNPELVRFLGGTKPEKSDRLDGGISAVAAIALLAENNNRLIGSLAKSYGKEAARSMVLSTDPYINYFSGYTTMKRMLIAQRINPKMKAADYLLRVNKRYYREIINDNFSVFYKREKIANGRYKMVPRTVDQVFAEMERRRMMNQLSQRYGKPTLAQVITRQVENATAHCSGEARTITQQNMRHDLGRKAA